MSLMVEAFQAAYPEKSALFEQLLVDCQSEEMTADCSNTKKEESISLEDFQNFFREKSRLSQSFAYWYTYVFELFPIARDQCVLVIGYCILVLLKVQHRFFFLQTD